MILGDYTCEKLEDTIFGGSGMLYEGSGAFKEMINKLQQQQPDFQPYQHFCSRFSFKLYQPVTRYFALTIKLAVEVPEKIMTHNLLQLRQRLCRSKRR